MVTASASVGRCVVLL